MIAALLLAFAMPLSAQVISTTPATGNSDPQRIDNIETSLQEMRSGRPTVTGLPTYQNGIKCGSGTTACVTFPDNSVQNSAGLSQTSSVSASGYWVFYGTVTVTERYTTATATLTVTNTGPPCTNLFCSIASTRTLSGTELVDVNVAAIAVSTQIYHIWANISLTSAGSAASIPAVFINGDYGANYEEDLNGHGSGIIGASGLSTNTGSGCKLIGTGESNLKVNDTMLIDLTIAPTSSNGKKALITGTVANTAFGNVGVATKSIGCWYNGSATITDIALGFPTANKETFSGLVKLGIIGNQ